MNAPITSNTALNPLKKSAILNNTLKTISLCIITAALAACSGRDFGLNNKPSDVRLSAQYSESEYYARAQDSLNKGHFNQAITELNELYIFYPAGRYGEQALLELIYAQHRLRDWEAAANASTQFLDAYPTSAHADYALYAKGVAYMNGSPKASQIIKLKQSERDTAYLRLSFAEFEKLIQQYPNSIYTPDASLRMAALYNQFAEHELLAARSYVKQQAYVAAIGRAKWIFQYYPQSTSVPEAMAILAHSYQALGINDLHQQYKQLLTINYPSYIQNDTVVLPDYNTKGFVKKTLQMVTLGRYNKINSQTAQIAQPAGTKTQTITKLAPKYIQNSATKNSKNAQDMGDMVNDDSSVDFMLSLPNAEDGTDVDNRPITP